MLLLFFTLFFISVAVPLSRSLFHIFSKLIRPLHFSVAFILLFTKNLFSFAFDCICWVHKWNLLLLKCWLFVFGTCCILSCTPSSQTKYESWIPKQIVYIPGCDCQTFSFRLFLHSIREVQLVSWKEWEILTRKLKCTFKIKIYFWILNQ